MCTLFLDNEKLGIDIGAVNVALVFVWVMRL
jgi:hypothetical protein